ncbi:MAG: DUF6290 family protein [Aerococcus sp.]|nr:DUF6290 family protein [Aerococcus sp.]
MSVISLRLNKEEEALFKKYAQFEDKTLSELFKEALLEQIEDRYDLEDAYTALAAYEQDPKTYSMEEVAQELGF